MEDASDRLIIEAFKKYFENSQHKIVANEVAVIGDDSGAITRGCYNLLKTANNSKLVNQAIRVNQDSLIFERLITKNLSDICTHYKFFPLAEELVLGAKVVLLKLPKSLRELREIADLTARYATKQVEIIAVGRVKHMTLNMNEVLREFFTLVSASLAKQKSRLLFATGPKQAPTQKPFPEWGSDPELDFQLASYGATFGGTSFDHGTRLLLKHLLPRLAEWPAKKKPLRVVDLGSGNGVVATKIARCFDSEVIAVDVSEAAVKATKATLKKAGVAEKVAVQRANACENIAEGWADLVVLNPPFHSGNNVNEKLAAGLIESAAKTLKENGELWLVMNSHLKYRVMLSRAVGELEQVARDKRFTVLRSIKINE